MRIRLSAEVHTLLIVALCLTLLTACQYASSSGASADGSTSPTPIKAGENQKVDKSCVQYKSDARTLRLAGKTEEAAAEFQKAIENGCGEIEIRRELGEMFRALGQFDRAIREYRLLVGVDSKDIRGHSALADILITDTKDYKAGLDEMILAENLLNAKDYAGRRNVDRQLARAHDGLGNISVAIKYYREYLKECAETPDATECKKIKERVLELGRQPPKSNGGT